MLTACDQNPQGRVFLAIVPYGTGTPNKGRTQCLCLHKADVQTHNLETHCFVMQVITHICTQEPDLKIFLLINVLSFLLVKMTSVIHSFVGEKMCFNGKLHGLYHALLGYQILALPIISELSGNHL